MVKEGRQQWQMQKTEPNTIKYTPQITIMLVPACTIKTLDMDNGYHQSASHMQAYGGLLENTIYISIVVTIKFTKTSWQYSIAKFNLIRYYIGAFESKSILPGVDYWVYSHRNRSFSAVYQLIFKRWLSRATAQLLHFYTH